MMSQLTRLGLGVSEQARGYASGMSGACYRRFPYRPRHPRPCRHPVAAILHLGDRTHCSIRITLPLCSQQSAQLNSHHCFESGSHTKDLYPTNCRKEPGRHERPSHITAYLAPLRTGSYRYLAPRWRAAQPRHRATASTDVACQN